MSFNHQFEDQMPRDPYDCEYDNDDMPTDRVTATWTGEELSIDFEARVVNSDYGVQGSPTFEDIEDVEVTGLNIMGAKIDIKLLPETVLKVLREQASEVDSWSAG